MLCSCPPPPPPSSLESLAVLTPALPYRFSFLVIFFVSFSPGDSCTCDSFSGYCFKAAWLKVDSGHKRNVWEEHHAVGWVLQGLPHQDHSGQCWSEHGHSFGQKAHIYSWLIFTIPIFWQRRDGTTDRASFVNGQQIRWWGACCKHLGAEQEHGPMLPPAPRSLGAQQGRTFCSCLLEEQDHISILPRSSRLVC